MERFKICEKETKTKTFSKEGLAQAQKQDPKERAKNEIKDWINATVDTLTSEVINRFPQYYVLSQVRPQVRTKEEIHALCCMQSITAEAT